VGAAKSGEEILARIGAGKRSATVSGAGAERAYIPVNVVKKPYHSIGRNKTACNRPQALRLHILALVLPLPLMRNSCVG
jgi:hypothetical protein